MNQGGSNGPHFERDNPSAGEVASRPATVAHFRDAASGAAARFPSWFKVGPCEWRSRLLAAVDIVEARASEFNRSMARRLAWQRHGASSISSLPSPCCTRPPQRPDTGASAKLQQLTNSPNLGG